MQSARNAWPDGTWTVDQIVGEGDTVAVALTLTGTHTGQLGNHLPTNRKGRMTTIEFWTFNNGKVIRLSHSSGIGRYRHAMLNGTLFKEQEET